MTDSFKNELEGRVVQDKMGREFKLPTRTSKFISNIQHKDIQLKLYDIQTFTKNFRKTSRCIYFETIAAS